MTDKQIQRLPTGVPGLDDVLMGGVFRGGIYIVQGAPGAGKTILANQLCFAHAAAGGRALYVTLLSENHARLLGHMQTLRFFDPNMVPDRVIYLSAFRILEENGLKGLVESLRREITQQKATMLVLDGLVSAEESAASPRELKKFVHELQTQAAITDCTTYLLTSAYMERQMVSAEHTMVDGIIELQSRLYGRRSEREIQVHKFRGSESLSGIHSFRIDDSGLTLYPRIESLYARPSAPEQADGPFTSIGVAEIDNMLGGGVTSHSNTLVLGPAGTGKTTLGLQFLGANPGGRGIFFSFSEPPAALQAKAKALGLPVAGMMASGAVQTLWQPVTEALLDEVCARLLDAVRSHKAARLFLDGADGLGKLTAEQGRISAVLTALNNELRSLGVMTLSTAETDLAGIVPGQPLAGLLVRDLSPIAENIIVLRHATILSETHRLMAVVKAREGKTDMRFRRYEIGSTGITLDADHTRAEDILTQIAMRREGGAMPASPPLADPLGRGG